jgi:hypothetical protein
MWLVLLGKCWCNVAVAGCRRRSGVGEGEVIGIFDAVVCHREDVVLAVVRRRQAGRPNIGLVRCSGEVLAIRAEMVAAFSLVD